jgi:hypothetical protein
MNNYPKFGMNNYSFRVFRVLIIVVFSNFLGNGMFGQEILNSPTYDSILRLRTLGSDNSKTLKQRTVYAKKAVKLSKKTKIDSIILKSTRILSTSELYSGNYDNFLKLNYETLKLSKNVNDSLQIAQSYHNIGWYHFQSRIQNDSAYFYLTTAIKVYDKVGGREARQVEIFQNLSDILRIEKDYLGSEENAVSGLKMLETSSQLMSSL